MDVLVWGLGYVGTVSAACFAQQGHNVVGVEINPAKVDAINNRKSSIKEPGLHELVDEMVAAGRLSATTDGCAKVKEADISLICVGTPSAFDGSPRLEYIRSVAAEIGCGLRDSDRYHVVVLRSTVFPGATREILCPILEESSGKKAGKDFGLVMNPEFLREASAVKDFAYPPYTVIGQLDQRSGEVVEKLYEDIDAPIYRVELEEAEMIKLVNNAFHALKIGFANEVGRFCDRLNIDSHVVMGLMAADKKLNISPAYLKPGFAFGGSCLPKDLRSLNHHARDLGIETPILDSILPSNDVQVAEALIKIEKVRPSKVAVLGLSFKPNTDDLRESPVIPLIRNLWHDGIQVTAYDPDVQVENMLGSNREYLERQLPQIHQILRPNLEETTQGSELVIVAQKRPEFTDHVATLDGKISVLDLVRMNENNHTNGDGHYWGLSW